MSTQQSAVERPDNSGVDQCDVQLAWRTAAAIDAAKKNLPREIPALSMKTTASVAPSSTCLSSNSLTAAIAPNHGGLENLHLQQQQQGFSHQAQQQQQQQQFTLACALAAAHRPSHVLPRPAASATNSRSKTTSKPAIATLTSPLGVASKATKRSKYVREGKWTEEEETYARLLIARFDSGQLEGVKNGTSLRSLLSEKLFCSPMRITKKYAGQGIGKTVYMSKMAKQLPTQKQGTGVVRHQQAPPSYPLNLDMFKMAEAKFLASAFPPAFLQSFNPFVRPYVVHPVMFQYPLAAMMQTQVVRSLAQAAANHHLSRAASSTSNNPLFLLPNSAQRSTASSTTASIMMFEEARMGPIVPKAVSQAMPGGSASLTMSKHTPLPPCPSFVSGTTSTTVTPMPQSGLPVQPSPTQILPKPPADIAQPKSSPDTSNLTKPYQEARGRQCRQCFGRVLQDPAASQKFNSVPAVSLPKSTRMSTTLQSNTGAVANGVDIPDFLAGFDNVAPPVPSQAASETAIAVKSDSAIPYSPTYTSRSFDDLHRFLGKGLSPQIDESTNQVATGEANVSGGRIFEGPAPFPSLTLKNSMTYSGTEDPVAASTSTTANKTRYKLQIRPTAKRPSAQTVSTTSSMEEVLKAAYKEALLVEAQKISSATSNEVVGNAHKLYVAESIAFGRHATPSPSMVNLEPKRPLPRLHSRDKVCEAPVFHDLDGYDDMTLEEYCCLELSSGAFESSEGSGLSWWNNPTTTAGSAKAVDPTNVSDTTSSGYDSGLGMPFEGGSNESSGITAGSSNPSWSVQIAKKARHSLDGRIWCAGNQTHEEQG